MGPGGPTRARLDTGQRVAAAPYRIPLPPKALGGLLNINSTLLEPTVCAPSGGGFDYLLLGHQHSRSRALHAGPGRNQILCEALHMLPLRCSNWTSAWLYCLSYTTCNS